VGALVIYPSPPQDLLLQLGALVIYPSPPQDLLLQLRQALCRQRGAPPLRRQ